MKYFRQKNSVSTSSRCRRNSLVHSFVIHSDFSWRGASGI